MPMVAYHAAQGTVTVMLGSTIPQLTPLLVSNPGDSFNPADPWYDFLNPSRQSLAFSRRFGFVMDANTDPLPDGTALWIRKLSSSPGLSAYRYRNSAPALWEPIFGTAGATNAFQWDGTMFHPAFTAPAGTNSYTARFEVSLVDSATGKPVPGATSAPFTFNWTDVPDGRPTVSIVPRLAITWPDSTNTYVLETSESLTNSDWTTVTNAPVVVDGCSSVLLAPNEAHRFFRLRTAP